MGAGAAGCQVKAGVLKPDETLTDNARRQYIKEVIEEIRFGTPDLPLLCGKLEGAGINACPDDLYDREKYPGFHEHYVDLYEKIAAGLNIQGCTPLAPFVWDFSLAMNLPDIPFDFDAFFNFPKLGLDISIDPKLSVDIPKLALKLPDLGIPMPPPDLPKIDLKLPDINIMPDLYFKISAILKLPQLLLDLALPPKVDLMLKIPQLDLAEICKMVKEKVIVTTPGAAGANVYEMGATSVLARKVTGCTTIAVTALVFGAGPLLCGGIGTKLNMAPEPEPEKEPPPPPAGVRESVVNAAKAAIGYNSAHKADIKNYVTYLFPYDCSNTNPRGEDVGYDFAYGLVKGKNQQGIIVPGAKYFSACGVGALAMHIHGGLKHPLIDKPFQDVVATEIKTSNGKTNLNAFVVINKIAMERNAIKYWPSGENYKNLDQLASVLAPGDIIVLGGDLQLDAEGKELGTSTTAEWITDKKVLKGHMQVVESVEGIIEKPSGKKNLKFKVIEAANGAWGDMGEGQYIANREMFLGYPGANWGGKIVSLSPGRYNVVVDYIIDGEKFHTG